MYYRYVQQELNTHQMPSITVIPMWYHIPFILRTVFSGMGGGTCTNKFQNINTNRRNGNVLFVNFSERWWIGIHKKNEST